MLNTIWAYVVSAATAAWAFVGSPLFNSALSALAGAYFGAKTAQGTAERNRFRNELTKEIRDTNAAISLSFAICNSIMAIKRQHVRQLVTDFKHDKVALEEHLAKRRRGEIQGNKPYEQRLDFRFLDIPNPPTERLRAHVLDRLSVIGRPLNLAVAIGDSSDSLKTLIASRNELIKEFKAAGEPDAAFMQRYFGLPTKDGHIDQVYADVLGGIHLHVESLIFFTYRLCEDLKEHGEELVEKYVQRLGRKGAPRVTEIDWTKARDEDLLPSNDDFKDWLRGFSKQLGSTPSRWKRLLLALK